jgi:NAD(P)H-dependent FMN reductase
MPSAMVVQVSTRPSRESDPIAKWTLERAKAHGKLDVTFVDLREEALPMFDEPEHPRFGRYVHEHTKRWSSKVKAADAFLFVTPEYNFGMPPSLLNAITYLHAEWAYKPAAFVSYGGVSGGTRSQQMAKLTLTSLKVMPLPEAVSIPFFTKSIKDGTFTPGDVQDKAITLVFDELAKWATALKTIRTT